jgi:hypothetical protein
LVISALAAGGLQTGHGALVDAVALKLVASCSSDHWRASGHGPGQPTPDGAAHTQRRPTMKAEDREAPTGKELAEFLAQLPAEQAAKGSLLN